MLNTQKTTTGTEQVHAIWDRIRLPLTLILAALFNVASACYNFRGLQLLEGDMPLLTIPLGIALAVSKTVAEKEFCANLFRTRPQKMLGVSAAFLLFSTVAVVFNALNVLHQQAGILSQANEERARADRWHRDTTALTQTKGQIRSATTQRIEKIESQLRDEQIRIDTARRAGEMPSYGERDKLKAEQRTLVSVQSGLSSLAPLPIDPPASPAEGTVVLSNAFSRLKDLRAQLSDDLQKGITEPNPTAESQVSKHPAIMLFEETAKRSSAARVAWSVAIVLELLAFAAMILGQPKITFAERIHGAGVVVKDVVRAVAPAKQPATIPFLVAGTGTRGYITVDGLRPLLEEDLQRAIAEIQPTLQVQISGLRTVNGDRLIPDVDVIDQLGGKELILEPTA